MTRGSLLFSILCLLLTACTGNPAATNLPASLTISPTIAASPCNTSTPEYTETEFAAIIPAQRTKVNFIEMTSTTVIYAIQTDALAKEGLVQTQATDFYATRTAWAAAESTHRPTAISLVPSITPLPNGSFAYPSLEDVILKQEDLAAYRRYASTSDFLSTEASVRIATDELEGHCLEDCAKNVWTGAENRLSIILIRAQSSSETRIALESIRKNIEPVDFEYSGDEMKWLDPSIKNTAWMVITRTDNFALGAVRGPLLIFLYLIPKGGWDDGPFFASMLISFANYQIAKLYEAGFPQ